MKRPREPRPPKGVHHVSSGDAHYILFSTNSDVLVEKVHRFIDKLVAYYEFDRREAEKTEQREINMSLALGEAAIGRVKQYRYAPDGTSSQPCIWCMRRQWHPLLLGHRSWARRCTPDEVAIALTDGSIDPLWFSRVRR